MICNHASDCNSPSCQHKEPHPLSEFCKDGRCRWAGDTKCVPGDRKEEINNLLAGYVHEDLLGTLVDQIVRVFKEKEE